MVAASTLNQSLMNESLHANNGLINQIKMGFDSDGFWHEGSIAYHNYTLTAMALHLEAAEYMGFDLFNFTWEDSDKKIMHIRDPFISHLKLIRPDFTFPRLNDAIDTMTIFDIIDLLEFTNFHWDEVIVSDLLAKIRSNESHQTYRSILWSSPINEDRALFSSVDYTIFGLSVIRMNGHYVLIDYGSHGGWHGHRDKLSIEVVTPNGAVFEDPGTVRYSLPASNDWYRSSYAHNTISIGDEEQEEMEGYLVESFHSSEGSVVVAGFHDNKRNITVERSLVVLSIDNGILIFDVFRVYTISDLSLSRAYHYRNGPVIENISSENSSSILPVPAKDYATLKQYIPNNSDYYLLNHSNSEFSSCSHFRLNPKTEIYTGFSNNVAQFVLLRDEGYNSEEIFASVHIIQSPVVDEIDIEWSDNNYSFINTSDFFIELDWNEQIPTFTKQPSIPSL